MSTTIRCPSCGYDSPMGGQFCSKCGQAITAKCRVCGEDNLYDARFCRQCRAELALAPVGLPLARALAWREQFRKLGWWDTPDEIFSPLLNQLAEQGQLPASDAPYEPWIFQSDDNGVSRGRMKYDWKPFDLDVNRPSKFWYSNQSKFMVATRCRLVIVEPKRAINTVVLYKDLTEVEWRPGADGHGFIDYYLKTRQGDVIYWRIRTKGPGLIDVVTALAASDPVARNWAHRGIDAKTQQQIGFVELVGDFLKEIVEVTE